MYLPQFLKDEYIKNSLKKEELLKCTPPQFLNDEYIENSLKKEEILKCTPPNF